MAIRVKCRKCGSVLKIKDELAGTDGKCPKCRAKFVVPVIEDAVQEESEELSPKPSHAPANRVSAPEPVKAPIAASDNAEFDPVAFLLDDSLPGAKASAGLTSPELTEKKSATDSRGRRQIVPPPPSPSRGGSTAIESSRSALNASANARDLLTKTMEESRLRASALPEERQRPRMDIIGSLTPLVNAIPYLVGLVVVVAGLYYLTSAVVTERLPLPKLADVRGTVLIDSQPLKDAVIFLTPIEREGLSVSGKKILLRTPVGLTDEFGRYRAAYMEGVWGAPLGNVRISVETPHNSDRLRIPPTYQHQLRQFNTDVREVMASGNEGKFNLDMKSP